MDRMNDLGIRTVIVPIDGSPEAERALPIAGFLATRLGTDVRLLAVARTPADGRRLTQAIEHAHGQLSDIVGQARVAFDYWPAERIVAASEPADAVVCLATRWAAWHSIARQVVFASNGPVVLVGPDARTRVGDDERIVSTAAGAHVTVVDRWATALELDHVVPGADSTGRQQHTSGAVPRRISPDRAAADALVEFTTATAVALLAWPVPTGWWRQVGRRARTAATVIRRSGCPVLACPTP